MRGDDNALSLALGLIYHKTLNVKGATKALGADKLKDTYKEALSRGAENFEVAKPSQIAKRNKGMGKNGKTVFGSGIGENTQAKELWRFYKGIGKVKDIALPKKRDKNNRRFGFMVIESADEAMKLIRLAHGSRLGKSILSLRTIIDQREGPNVSHCQI